MNKLILILLLTSFLLGDYKIGIPENPVSNTFDNLILELKKKDLLVKNNIKIIKIDMKLKDIDKLKKEIEEVDLFFITGSYFNLFFNTINPKVNTLVIGNKKFSGIKKFDKKRLLGIYRMSAMGNIKDLLISIDKDNLNTGILTNKNSVFHKHRVKKLINLAKKNDINMIDLPYENRSDLDKIFKNNQGKLNSIQLWPASLNKKDMRYVSELQFKYKIPLIAQKMYQVKNGAVLGYLLDYNKTLQELSLYIEKLSSGLHINELKSQDGKHIHVVNLNSVAKLDLNLSQKLIKNSKIIVQKKVPQIKTKSIDGKYTIAIPEYKHVLYTKYLKQLENYGYIENKNLKVFKFNPYDKVQNLPKETKLIFTMGNFIDTVINIKKDIPLVLYSIYDFKNEFNKKNIFHLDINEDDIIKKIQLLFPKITNIKVIGDVKAKMPFLNNKMSKQLSKFGHNISTYLYKNISEIETVFKNMNKKKDMILLFPVSIKQKDIKKLVALQDKYKVIIVSQIKKEVKKGIAFGITTDIDFIAKTLASNSHDILQGIKPDECIVPKIDLKFYINLKSLRDIGYKISEQTLKRAEVIIQ